MSRIIQFSIILLVNVRELKKKIDKLNMRNSLRNKNTQATDKIIRTKKNK